MGKEHEKKRRSRSKKPSGIVEKEPESPRVEVLPRVRYPESFGPINDEIPFNKDFHQLFSHAAEISRSLHHNYLGPWHLLMAFYSIQNDRVRRFLYYYMVNDANIALRIKEKIGAGDSTIEGPLSFSPRIITTVEDAAVLAKEDRMTELGPEYVFISLMNQREEFTRNVVESNVKDLDIRLEVFRASLPPRRLPPSSLPNSDLV